MKFVFLLFIMMGNTLAFAHEVTVTGSHISLQRQNSSGRQLSAEGYANLNDNQRMRLGAQYLERFDLYERIFLVGFEQRFESFYVGANAEYGHNGRILPHHRFSLLSGQAVAPGISFYEEIRTAEYTATTLDEVILNMEIEKIKSVVIVPMTRFGRAKFKSPSETKTLFGYGLKWIYYRENIGQAWFSVFRGQEPAQVVLGSFNEVLNSKSIATGIKYEWNESITSGLSVDYTHYDLINNHFLTTSLTTTWRW